LGVLAQTCRADRGSTALTPAIHNGALTGGRRLEITRRPQGIDHIHAIARILGILVISRPT